MDTSNNHRERIAEKATEDASKPGDINTHCPYPFGTTEARLYRRAFMDERTRMERLEREAIQPAFTDIHSAMEHDDAPDEAEFADTQSPLCDCNTALTPDELNFNRCAVCGKELLV